MGSGAVGVGLAMAPKSMDARSEVIDVVSRMQRVEADLSPAERQVLKAVRNDYDAATRMTIAELATRAGVSQPTVTRFCRSVGCSSYGEFKIMLATTLTVAAAYLRPERQFSDDVGQLAQSVMNRAMNAMRDCLNALDTEAVGAAIDILSSARRIDIYGQGGGSRKYVLVSLDQSLRRMGLEYVDIFYSHRFDAQTPLEETMAALDHAVRQGKALYVGISSYSAEQTREAASIARDLGTPLLIHQPSYSMLNRWIEGGLLDELEVQGMGCIVFTALAQGLLTDRYLDGVPADSRAARSGSSIGESHLDESTLRHVRALNEIARERGQKLAQLALQWALRDRRVTSAVIGASSVEQLDTNLDALAFPALTEDELRLIDRHAVDAGINLWAVGSD